MRKPNFYTSRQTCFGVPGRKTNGGKQWEKVELEVITLASTGVQD
jgi:hypothetical protein